LLKAVAVGGIVIGLAVLLPMLLAFAIVGGIIVGLVGMGWLCVRFLLFCLGGFRSAPRATAPAATPEPTEVMPPPRRASQVPEPDLYGRHYQQAWRYRQRFGRRDPSSWGILATALLVFCVLAVAFRSHSFNRSRVGVKLSDAVSRATEKINRARKYSDRLSVRYEKPVTPAVVAAEAADQESPTWKVVGRGENSQDAYQDALEKGQTKVTAYLRAQSPPVAWTPTTEDIERLVKGPKEGPVARELEGLGLVYETTLQVGISSQEFKAILDHEGLDQSKERLLWLLKGLGVVVGILAAVACYIRLDEWSKGYYTGWLRLGAASFIAAAVASVWFLPF
jgi:hypothetical protein